MVIVRFGRIPELHLWTQLVKAETPGRSRRRSLDAPPDTMGSMVCLGMRRVLIAAIDMQDIAANQKIHLQFVYWTKRAPMTRPETMFYVVRIGLKR